MRGFLVRRCPEKIRLQMRDQTILHLLHLRVPTANLLVLMRRVRMGFLVSRHDVASSPTTLIGWLRQLHPRVAVSGRRIVRDMSLDLPETILSYPALSLSS